MYFQTYHKNAGHVLKLHRKIFRKASKTIEEKNLQANVIIKMQTNYTQDTTQNAVLYAFFRC